MTNKELKPCPFCRAPAELVRDHIGLTLVVRIECVACEARTRNVTSSLEYCAKDEAAELWNERSADNE